MPHGISVIVTAPTVLRELMRDLDVPDGVAALGYDEEDLDALVEGAMRQQRLLAGAPRPVQVGDLRHIFTASMHTG